jgi:hypothetical protein
MKNIHLLPTENPSRLFKDDFGKYFISINIDQEQNHFKPQHIYITNSEEIKEGDWWFSTIDKIIFKVTKEDVLVTSQDGIPNGFYKIILTTDQDLIADGIQAIDDEFLEWFVKNPTCEEVKTRKIENEWIYNADVPKVEKTLTVKELIEQLSKVDQNLPVYISGVGLTVNDSWDAPLQFDNDTVDVYKGKCRIHMSTVG